MALDQAGHVGVEHAEDVGQHLDDGDAATAGDQGFGGFDADQAAADDHHILGPALGKHGLDSLGIVDAV